VIEVEEGFIEVIFWRIGCSTTFCPTLPHGRGIEMGAVTITVDSTESFKQRVKAAFSGKRQQERISFESFDLLWKVLAPNRMALGDWYPALCRSLAPGHVLTSTFATRRSGADWKRPLTSGQFRSARATSIGCRSAVRWRSIQLSSQRAARLQT
jgi:hypothetical protein